MNKKVEEQLTKIQRVALSRSFGKDKELSEASKAIQPGMYQGSNTIRVDWMLQKGESTEQAPTANLMSRAVIAKAIILSGVQAENFFAALKRAAMDELVKRDPDVARVLQEKDERIAGMIDQLEAEVISQLPKVSRAGATKVMATVTVLDAKKEEVSA